MEEINQPQAIPQAFQVSGQPPKQSPRRWRIIKFLLGNTSDKKAIFARALIIWLMIFLFVGVIASFVLGKWGILGLVPSMLGGLVLYAFLFYSLIILGVLSIIAGIITWFKFKQLTYRFLLALIFTIALFGLSAVMIIIPMLYASMAITGITGVIIVLTNRNIWQIPLIFGSIHLIVWLILFFISTRNLLKAIPISSFLVILLFAPLILRDFQLVKYVQGSDRRRFAEPVKSIEGTIDPKLGKACFNFDLPNFPENYGNFSIMGYLDFPCEEQMITAGFANYPINNSKANFKIYQMQGDKNLEFLDAYAFFLSYDDEYAQSLEIKDNFSKKPDQCNKINNLNSCFNTLYPKTGLTSLTWVQGKIRTILLFHRSELVDKEIMQIVQSMKPYQEILNQQRFLPAQETLSSETIFTEEDIPDSAREVLGFAKYDLSKRLGISSGNFYESIRLLRGWGGRWKDTSLGCPQEGFIYSNVATPGWQFILEFSGKRYDYRTSQYQAKLCREVSNSPSAGEPSLEEAYVTQENIPSSAQRLVNMARDDLIQKLGIKSEDLKFVAALEKEWPDAYLGCPQGEIVNQIATSGWQFLFEAGGKIYDYRTDQTSVKQCLATSGQSSLSCTKDSDCSSGLVCVGRGPAAPSAETPGVCISQKQSQGVQ